MKKYLSQLRPTERRFVVGVAVVLIIIINYVLVWPHFSDYGNAQNQFQASTVKLKNYKAAVAEIPDLQKKVKQYENEGGFVPLEDQGVNFMRTIQQQAAESSVALQNFGRPNTQTNDAFFVEQIQNINVLAPESNLVDFLYRLGSGSSMIRVRDLTLQPDPPRQRLTADIRLVANYQKTAPATAAKTATAKAK